MTVTEVHNKAVTIEGCGWSVCIINGKIRAQMGFINPAEFKKVFRTYYAIINK